jgi:hypothetical protein
MALRDRMYAELTSVGNAAFEVGRRIGKITDLTASDGPWDGPPEPLRYMWGFNTQGTGGWEVLDRQAEGQESYLVMFAPSHAKAKAIAMILNAPEE